MTISDAIKAAHDGYVSLEDFAVENALGKLVPWAFVETLRALSALGAAFREGTISEDEFLTMRAVLRKRMGLE